MSSRGEPTVDSRVRIRTAALRLFAERGVAATSLREVARAAGVAPGLVVHHFGGKDGLHDAIDGFVLDLFHEALDSVPFEGPTREVAAARDAAVTRMFEDNPEAIDYLRRVVVTPDPGDVGLARRLVTETTMQTQMLRDHGLARTAVPVNEQAVEVLVRQIGSRLLQPALERLWELSGSAGAPPTARVTLHRD